MNTEFEENLGSFDVPNYKDDLTNEDLEYIQELLKKQPKNLKRNKFSKVDKKSVKTETEKPKNVVEEATQGSFVEINSTQKMVVNDEETNKIPKLTSEKTQQKMSFKIKKRIMSGFGLKISA